MITERGTIKAETAVNAEMQREFMRTTYILSVIALIVGSVGLAAYLAWDISSIFIKIKEPGTWILFIVAVFFAFGFIFVMSCRRAIKQVEKGPAKAEVYEFFNNYMIAEDYLNGEKVANVKIYYNQILKRRETKNYLFFYVQATAACPVSKAGMSEGELNTLRGLFGLPVKSQSSVSLAVGGEEGAPAPETAPSDPFADMTSDGADNKDSGEEEIQEGVTDGDLSENSGEKADEDINKDES